MPEINAILFQNIQLILTVLLLVLLLLIPKKLLSKTVIIAASLALTLRYVIWRGVYTLGTADYLAVAITVGLFIAELYGVMQYLLFLYQTARTRERKLPWVKTEDLPAVDVLITVYNEPASVLLRTVVGCMAQDYPAEKLNVYVLDDGKSDEIKRLCEDAGCGYITRPTNEDAKAGNINHALKKTTSEVVAIFDCDHVPVRSFLKETVGHFKDSGVAFVQVPHHFYNPDIFQKNLRLEHEIVNEQDLFFKVIEPGRDYYNAAFFAGSCGLFRRSALAETGGLMTETLTEDIHTSMELHSRGWKSVYVNKILSAGLSPENSLGYLKQRKRWAEGGVQLFVLDNPLFKRGLRPSQRICYFASINYFFHSFPRIVYLTAPLMYLFFGYAPIVTDAPTLLYFFIPHYMAQIVAFNTLSKGYRNPFWSDVYEVLMCFGLSRVVLRTLLKPRERPFVVTPKGVQNDRLGLDLTVVVPHAVLLTTLTTAGLLGVEGIYDGTGNSDALWISLAWIGYNSLLTVAAVTSALERPQRRSLIRLARRIPCELLLPDRTITCITRDLSEGGLSARLEEPVIFPQSVVRLRLAGGFGEVTELKAEVLRQDIGGDGSIFLGLKFIEMDDSARSSVIRQMYSAEDSWSEHHSPQSTVKTIKSLMLLIGVVAWSFVKETVLKRISPRVSFRLPCAVTMPSSSFEGKTRNISATGLSAEVRGITELPPGVEVEVYTDEGKVTLKGELVWQVKRSKGKVLFGMRFSDNAKGSVLWEKLKAA